MYGEPLSISVVIVSGPGALPRLRDLSTMLSSAMVKGESHSITGAGEGGIRG